jgi:ribosomal-protein-alanine N-acetyltransferase
MTHKGTIALETERLILRRFTLDDAEAMFRNWASDPEVTKYARQAAQTSVDEARLTCNEIVSSYENNDFYYWNIVLNDLPIGRINITQVNDVIEMVHISFMIGMNWWNKGFTTEALDAIVRFFFEEVGANRIEGRNDPQNPSSEKVMIKCGFRYEGTLRKGGKNSFGLVDCKQYAILAEDYLGKSTHKSQGYIMDLRRYIGHQPIILAGAEVVVENSAGQILLQLRRDNNCWGNAGGSLELGESVEDAARRELFEEPGLTANSLELLGVFSGEGMRYTYPNGDIVENVATVFVCRDFSGELKPQESEVAELRWFNIDALPDNISPPVVRTINAYLAKRR